MASTIAREVTRRIPEPVKCLLWGRAAGRCEFAGCNRPLWKSSVTQEEVNIAQKAHIYSFSHSGPRGHAGLSAEEINGLGNLMLVCHECHRKVDHKNDGGRYTSELLRAMKSRHECRIEIVTGVDPKLGSHVLLYGANIGNHSSPLLFSAVASCLFPERYPAEDKAIALGTVNSALVDRDDEFWRVEREQLVRTFASRVKERLAVGEIEHLSVFALAPQPLLILLGSLLTDITQVDVYQLHREPADWSWEATGEPAGFTLIEPAAVAGPAALVLALSAPVDDDRILGVLGPKATVWRITIPQPDNDFLRARSQLCEFRRLMRRAFARISAVHGHEAVLHVFPVMPVALAVELGRVHMPKADSRLRIFDQLRGCGFVPALDIPAENHDG